MPQSNVSASKILCWLFLKLKKLLESIIIIRFRIAVKGGGIIEDAMGLLFTEVGLLVKEGRALWKMPLVSG